jgi:hypothetical protein
MCDICISPQENHRISAPRMREFVEKGFDPFSTQLVNQSTIDTWSRGLYGEIYGGPEPKDFTPAYSAALENWRRDLVSTETSDWLFCDKCYEALTPFYYR